MIFKLILRGTHYSNVYPKDSRAETRKYVSHPWILTPTVTKGGRSTVRNTRRWELLLFLWLNEDCLMSFILPYSESSNPKFFWTKEEFETVRERTLWTEPLRLTVQHSDTPLPGPRSLEYLFKCERKGMGRGHLRSLLWWQGRQSNRCRSPLWNLFCMDRFDMGLRTGFFVSPLFTIRNICDLNPH